MTGKKKTNQNKTQSTIYVFGNEYLEQDSLALKVAKSFEKKYKIVHCTSPEQLMDVKGEITIIDVVKNIDKPIMIKSVEDIKTRKITSLHDFDLGFFLSLMQKIGEGKKVKIIGVPSKGNIQEISEKVKKWI